LQMTSLFSTKKGSVSTWRKLCAKARGPAAHITHIHSLTHTQEKSSFTIAMVERASSAIFEQQQQQKTTTTKNKTKKNKNKKNKKTPHTHKNSPNFYKACSCYSSPSLIPLAIIPIILFGLLFIPHLSPAVRLPWT